MITLMSALSAAPRARTILKLTPLARKPTPFALMAVSSSPVWSDSKAPPVPANTAAPDTSIENTLASVRVTVPSSTVIVASVNSTSPLYATRAPAMSTAALAVTRTWMAGRISRSTSRSSGSRFTGSVSTPVAVAQSIRGVNAVVPLASVARFSFTVPVAHNCTPSTPSSSASSSSASMPT